MCAACKASAGEQPANSMELVPGIGLDFAPLPTLNASSSWLFVILFFRWIVTRLWLVTTLNF